MLKLCNASKQDRSACRCLSLEGDTLRCQSTELHEDLVVDFKCSQFVIHRRSFMRKNIAIRTDDLLHPSTVRWDDIRLTAGNFSSSALKSDLSELYSPTSWKSTSVTAILSLKMFSKLRWQLTSTFLQRQFNWFHWSMSWRHRSTSTLIGQSLETNLIHGKKCAISW